MLTLASVYAMNGKSVEVDNTDAEGRLVLAGKLQYDACFELCLNQRVSRRHILYGYRVQTTHVD